MSKLVNLRVRFDHVKVAQLITSIKKTSSMEFLQKVNLKAYAEESKEYLSSLIPISGGESHNQLEFGKRASEGWKATVNARSQGFGFSVYHPLYKTSERWREMIDSLDLGNRFQIIEFQTPAAFEGKIVKKLGTNVFIPPGVPVARPARPGVRFRQKTAEHIQGMLVDLRLEVKRQYAKTIKTKK